ncbi:MAG: sugar ABC transporter permease [Eubacterium sp.]|nr:sugar ABC transporter permease [Eubacterium sp.]
MAKKSNSIAVRQKGNKLKYGKWGLIFILPFFIAYAVFQFYPLIMTFYKSMFTEYQHPITLEQISQFKGLDNYVNLFQGTFLKYFGNTMILWLLGFIPQILVSLLFASWFTDIRLKLKGTGAMKVVLYLPNMLMASSIAVLFAKLFALDGPINQMFGTDVFFLNSEWGIRLIVAGINFLMWTGNTTILLMAGIMGIDPALYEAAAIDGASARQQFLRITLPMLKPIMLYVLVTSMIGGLQMFDIPNLIVKDGGTSQVAYTVIMDVSKGIAGSGNVGLAGAESVLLFLIAAIIGGIMFKSMESDEEKEKRKNRKRQKMEAKIAKGV